MKKTFDIFFIIIIFFIIYFLQSNFFTWFNIAGVKPNLFIVLIAIIGLFMKKEFGFGFGIVLGLFLDFFIGVRIGLYAATLGIAGLIAGILDKNFSKDNRLTLMMMISLLTIIAEIALYIFEIVFLKINTDPLAFAKNVLIEAIYNAIIVIILYPLIIKFGGKIEEDFVKNNNVLNFLY